MRRLFQLLQLYALIVRQDGLEAGDSILQFLEIVAGLSPSSNQNSTGSRANKLRVWGLRGAHGWRWMRGIGNVSQVRPFHSLISQPDLTCSSYQHSGFSHLPDWAIEWQGIFRGQGTFLWNINLSLLFYTHVSINTVIVVTWERLWL